MLYLLRGKPESKAALPSVFDMEGETLQTTKEGGRCLCMLHTLI